MGLQVTWAEDQIAELEESEFTEAAAGTLGSAASNKERFRFILKAAQEQVPS